MRSLSPRRAPYAAIYSPSPLAKRGNCPRDIRRGPRLRSHESVYTRRAVLNRRRNYFRAKLKDFSETAREDPRRFLIIPVSVLPKLFPLRFDDCVAVNVFPVLFPFSTPIIASPFSVFRRVGIVGSKSLKS